MIRVKTPEQRAEWAKYMRRWHAENLEKSHANNRRSFLRHREKRMEYLREWRIRNPEIVKDYRRSYYIRYRDKINEKISLWKKRNKDKVVAYTQKRRALSKQNLARFIERLYLRTFCYWCSRILTPNNRTVDHIIPISRGGDHSEENLVACCGSCNYGKGTKLYWEWDGELAS